MSNRVSRRQWLLSTAVTSTAVTTAMATPLWAQQSDRLANVADGPWLPPTSRSVQLTGQHADGDEGKPPVVTTLAVDPRGEFVAAAGDDHLIRILTAGTLAPIRVLRGHRDLIRTMAFDAGGTRLASAGNDGQLLLWDRDRSFRLQQRMSGTPSLTCVRFSPEGNEIAAVGFGPEVYLIGGRDSKQHTFRCPGSDLRAVAFRDDSRILLAAGRDGDLTMFDFVTGTQSSHPIHEGRIHGIVFHYNSNRCVCVADDGFVTVFDTQTRELVDRVSVTTGKLFAAAVINSQLVAVAGSDNVIRIVNSDDGTIFRKLEGHIGSVSSLGAGGGLLFSGSYDTTLRRWAIAEIEAGGQRIAGGDSRMDR